MNEKRGVELDKKTVLKNTGVLYIRMIILMVIGFITTRVVLKSLGEVDYGLNNAIAGFVALFGILTGSLNSSISRFLTYELGRNNHEQLNKIFSTAFFIQLLMAIIVSIFIETVGLWFLNNYLTIPGDRLLASHWALHFAVINSFVTLLFVPFSATIISHEKMQIYAYVSVVEGVFNLAIALLISLDIYVDKLIFYSAAICVNTLIVNLLYVIYCAKNFKECRLSIIFESSLIKKLGGFAGWNLFGVASGILREQGINILFNIFLGPSVNAARGIANQASGIANKFSSGFMTALYPQITKSYASGDFKYMYSLVYQGTRMAFYLYFIVALPIFIETDYMLEIWLGEYPLHTSSFIKILLLQLLLDGILAGPLVTIMLATGKIKKYQVLVGGIQFLNVPFAFCLLSNGFSPESVLIMSILIALNCMIARFYMLYKMIKLPVVQYIKEVLCNILLVSLLSMVLPFFVNFMLPQNNIYDFVNITVCIICTAFIILTIGLKREEKQVLKSKLLRILNR